MKLTKVAFAIASVLAITAGSANAGQIDSSSATLATEVIYSNAQVVRAASKSYTFTGAVDARANEQRLQLQWKLTGANLQWARGLVAGAGDVAFGAANAVPVPLAAAQKLLTVTGIDATNAAIGWDGAKVGALTGFNVEAFLHDNQTLVFNITIPQAATNIINNATFQINGQDFGSFAVPQNVGVTNVLSVSGATACVAPQVSTDIEFKHFTTHNGNRDLMTGTTADSEHLRPAASNVGRFMNFTQNLRFTFANAVQSQVDAATMRTTFKRTPVAAGTYVAAAAATGVAEPRLHRIATGIDLTKVAAGLDLDYTNQYGTPTAVTGDFAAAAFSTTTAGTTVAGVIETTAATGLTIQVKSPLGAAGWAAGSSVVLLNSADAAIAGALVTAPDANGVATITLPTDLAMAAATVGTGARLYYVVNGIAEIPQSSQFEVTASLNKSAVGNFREQNNVCSEPLAGVGGGIKIDVRNYASFATFGATGPQSVVRLINNSESQKADVFAQLIYADGRYGPWGRLADLAPRAVQNYSNKEIEAALTTAAAAANPFGASTVYTNATGATPVASNGGDRLRIVSNSGTTLRVQSFMVMPNGMILDTSQAQGVDFENTTNNRSPGNAVDAQPNSQDAINGLGR